MEISFRKSASQIIQSSWHAPWALNMGGVQAEKATFFMKTPFWGCPMLNLKADLPFHVRRSFYAGFMKEIPAARPAYFQRAKLLRKFKLLHKLAEPFSMVNEKHIRLSIVDKLVKNQKAPLLVIPVKAGIQENQPLLDSRFRGSDAIMTFYEFINS